ncbi:MAG TPA: hypothetical protein VMV62_00895 [Candidatus Paceibacterota bacterium]|nr:hypothetical protein [Candidatus Paceibacterota bacterium]
MDAIEKLGNLTYAIEHNRNCPSKFLVRIVTVSTGGLDMLPTRETGDTFAYGATLDEAVDRVLGALSVQTGRLRQAYSTV